MFLSQGRFEYPFGKRWVYASAFMAGISIVFAVFMLSEEGYLALIKYFAFTFLTTIAVLALKFYIYFVRRQESAKTTSFDMKEEVPKRRWRWSFIALLCLAIASLFVPLILLVVLEPLWWLICIGGYVPAVNIPEVVLYLYSQRVAR